jgi:hypothetical protein
MKLDTSTLSPTITRRQTTHKLHEMAYDTTNLRMQQTFLPGGYVVQHNPIINRCTYDGQYELIHAHFGHLGHNSHVGTTPACGQHA